jgi:hypothetical protein
LEASVFTLLTDLGLNVYPQPPGSNIDLKADHPTLDIGFAIEVTGIKDVVRKDSNKVSQAWEYIQEREGTPEEYHKLIIVANTKSHLKPE